MVRGNYLVKYEKKDNPFIQKKKSDAVSEIPWLEIHAFWKDSPHFLKQYF